MDFRIDITPRAESDLDRIFNREAIDSLVVFPERHEVAHGVLSDGKTVRRMPYGRLPDVYLVYYRIDEDVVKVLHVRHGARRPLRRI